MKTLQFRIPMPLELDKYALGQRWAVIEKSKLETGDGEGVQILVDEEIPQVIHRKYTNPSINRRFDYLRLNIFIT